MKEYGELSLDQQIKVIVAYKEFLQETSLNTELDQFSSFRFSFFQEAIASGEFDCFYAGWPSRSTKVGGKKLCSSPMKSNPEYRARASSCGSNSLLCQPSIFGKGICVSIATPQLRNSAFSQCESKFKSSGKTLADVAKELNTPESLAELEELVGVSERICREGFQKALCNRLREKILAVKKQASSDSKVISAAETALKVNTSAVEPEVDCDPNTPGIQTVPPKPVVAQVESGSVQAQNVPDESSVVSPAEAVALVSSGQLTYHGRGLLPGSDTIGSCVYSNDKVFVIVHACRKDGKESPVTNIDIITKSGQKTNYYIENSDQTERTIGTTSQVRRENYDRSWSVSYQELGPVPATYSLESMRSYLLKGQNNIGDNCQVGGMMVKDPVAKCIGAMKDRLSDWGTGATQFSIEPGEAWYSFLKTMRQKVQSNAGR